jgi:AhpD family alkylhydroperoxidase
MNPSVNPSVTEATLHPRLDYRQASPEGVKAMLHLESYVRHCGLEPGLLELIKIRASQMNGCAYCIDMHTKDARAHGEREQRIYALPAWAETPFYSDRERAALAWTEALTDIQQGHAPDEVYNEVARHFTEAERMNLTLAITTINAWNRIAIAFRAVPGSYQPPAVPAEQV